MQSNQATNTVQVDIITNHPSISLRMVEHTKHAIIVEHARDVAVLIKVQLVQLCRCYNNLNRRPHCKMQFHQTIYLPHNLLTHHYHHHQFHYPNTLTHFLILLFLQRIITA